MSGFLARLAGFATGRPVDGVARIALPSRFAPVPSAPLANADAAAATDDLGLARKSSDGGAAPARAPENPAREFAPVRPPEESRRPLSESATVREPVEASAPHASIRPEPGEPQRAFPAPNFDASPLPLPAHSRATQESAVPVVAAATPKNPSRLHAPIRATVIAAREPARANAAPLNADIVAARVHSAHNDAPPVHVTIDRIDVRVAPPAKPAAPPRARRAPSQSLAEYLRGPERGGRS